MLAFLLSQRNIPYEREHRFHATRKWRFDFALPRWAIAVEIEGGLWIQGRHNRPASMIKDFEKYNSAAILGWKILKFTPQQIKSGEALEWIQEAIMAVDSSGG